MIRFRGVKMPANNDPPSTTREISMSDIEYFYSAHSAFAYLGSAKLLEIASAAGRNIVHKPVYLDEVVKAMDPGGFKGRGKAHRAYYFGREIERWAEHRGVPFKVGIPANHFHDMSRANGLLIAGIQQSHNVDRLSHALMEAHWSRHADLADEVALAEIASSVGLDPAALLSAALSPEVQSIYKANTAEAIERLIFGSPTYFVDGDMFYGQDHLELVERAFQQPYAETWIRR